MGLSWDWSVLSLEMKKPSNSQQLVRSQELCRTLTCIHICTNGHVPFLTEKLPPCGLHEGFSRSALQRWFPLHCVHRVCILCFPLEGSIHSAMLCDPTPHNLVRKMCANPFFPLTTSADVCALNRVLIENPITRNLP